MSAAATINAGRSPASSHGAGLSGAVGPDGGETVRVSCLTWRRGPRARAASFPGGRHG